MKAILQRVHSASVSVDQKLVSQIGRGLLVLAAVGKDDSRKEAETLASKVLRLKLWDDEGGGRWKKSVQDINGDLLCVSQFTLYASTKKGNKPDFHKSAGGSKAQEIYDHFFGTAVAMYDSSKVKNGIFQAMMDVALVNDGPVQPQRTILETPLCVCGDSEILFGQVTIEINVEPTPSDDSKTAES